MRNFVVTNLDLAVGGPNGQAQQFNPSTFLLKLSLDPSVAVLNASNHPLAQLVPPTVKRIFRPPFPWLLGSRCHASEVVGRSFTEALAILCLSGEGRVSSLRVVSCFLDMDAAVGDVVNVGEVGSRVRSWLF